MSYNQAILQAAGDHLGTEEWPGSRHNPSILKMWEEAGIPVKDDETPWCAAFVASVLASLGLPHSGKPNARSYMTYGTEVSVQNAQPGDVVVFWRGSPDGWQGHVAFLVRFEGSNVIVRGGNQGNRVSDAPYPTSRIIAIRRADGRAAEPTRPTLRAGDRGAFVLDLQDQLDKLKYFVGKIDGIFGSRTRESVLAFQADHGLTVDGVVGQQTWAALLRAEPRDLRDIVEEDLDSSRTIKAAKGVTNTATAAGVLTGGVTISEAISYANQLEDVEGWLETGTRIAMAYWPMLIIIVGAIVFWYYGMKIREYRVDDARTGRNMGR